MDALDRKLLGLLEKDGRLGFSELARALKHGRDIIEYRFHRAIRDRVIHGVIPIVDPSARGLSVYKTYLRLVRPDEHRDELLRAISENPHALCCATCHGTWDLIFNVAASSPAQFFSVRSAILERHHAQIRDLGFAIITDMRHYTRKYLSNTVKEWRLFNAPRPIELDPIDQALLKGLLEDGRRSFAELARRAGTSETIARNRLLAFERDGLIAGYRAAINREALGLSGYKLQVELIDLDPGTAEAVMEFAKDEEFCFQSMVQLGTWPCELNVEARDNRHLAEIIERLRAAFPKSIGRVDVLLYSKEEFLWEKSERAEEGRELAVVGM